MRNALSAQLLRCAVLLMRSDSWLDGAVLSAHGGRQLDGSVSPLDVLP